MTALLLALLLSRQPPPPQGALCASGFPDHAYTIRDAHFCRRHVVKARRAAVFARDGIPAGLWSLYELDHVIPLCLGGSNDVANLWAELWTHAHRKDVLEWRLCRALKAGTMTQAAAVAELRASLK